MRILACNPGHDGAIAYLVDGELVFSLEAEKDSKPRYSPLAADDVFAAIADLDPSPDVVCTGGFWLGESSLLKDFPHVFYFGIDEKSIGVGQRTILNQQVGVFSSSHERSHLLCAFGMSGLPKGIPCYALVWEGVIGAFYEIDADFTITQLGEPMTHPGVRYAFAYGLADPTFDKTAVEARFTDAGKLMALASFARGRDATPEEERLLTFLLAGPKPRLDRYDGGIESAPHYNVGVENPDFRDFVGILSDRIFDTFHAFAREHMSKRLPLLIAGGCGLNCDWNSRWRTSGLFPEVFVPPVANDSGSAIGTAIDAQRHFTGDPTIRWDVYAGQAFRSDTPFDPAPFEIFDADAGLVADLLAKDLILGWVNGRWEIGPRALGNRSILAAPFTHATRIRLNRIKQREQFRPIAPICLEEDAARWFGCDHPSPYMLYTYIATTDALAAVTHVNGTARIQTVSQDSNAAMFDLLSAFRARTGYGVLCNTSLNFNGTGFINTAADLAAYTLRHELDGFVMEGRAYIRRGSEAYRAYRDR
jgi:predicted NodU family carbamoyl transferase